MKFQSEGEPNLLGLNELFKKRKLKEHFYTEEMHRGNLTEKAIKELTIIKGKDSFETLMNKKELDLVDLQNKFKLSEKVEIKLKFKNIEQVTIKAYKLNTQSFITKNFHEDFL